MVKKFFLNLLLQDNNTKKSSYIKDQKGSFSFLMMMSMKMNNHDVNSELNLYLEIPQISIKENMDALEWWKTRERTFPKL